MTTIPSSIHMQRFWDRVAIGGPDECWLWLHTKDGPGYGLFRCDHKNIGAHRVSWMWANERDIPDGMLICHTCDNRPCVNPSHLFLGTVTDNALDMYSKKRRVMFHGEDSWMSKLTEVQVKEIRAVYAMGGITYTQLGARFGVGRKAVSAIVRGESWSHIL